MIAAPCPLWNLNFISLWKENLWWILTWVELTILMTIFLKSHTIEMLSLFSLLSCLAILLILSTIPRVFLLCLPSHVSCLTSSNRYTYIHADAGFIEFWFWIYFLSRVSNVPLCQPFNLRHVRRHVTLTNLKITFTDYEM